jgi:hypothetical protein
MDHRRIILDLAERQRMTTMEEVPPLAIRLPSPDAPDGMEWYALYGLEPGPGIVRAWELKRPRRKNEPPEPKVICYTCSLAVDGYVSCGCLGHLKWGTHCKHLSYLKRLGLLGCA